VKVERRKKEDCSPGQPEQKVMPYVQNNQKKMAEGMIQAVDTYLASAKPWVQTSVPPKPNHNNKN
jgi:hypothetical protein